MCILCLFCQKMNHANTRRQFMRVNLSTVHNCFKSIYTKQNLVKSNFSNLKSFIEQKNYTTPLQRPIIKSRSLGYSSTKWFQIAKTHQN